MERSHSIHSPERASGVPGIVKYSHLCLNGLGCEPVDLPLTVVPPQPHSIKALANVRPFPERNQSGRPQCDLLSAKPERQPVLPVCPSTNVDKGLMKVEFVFVCTSRTTYTA